MDEEEGRLYLQVKEDVVAVREFYVHLGTYLFVILILFTINILFTPNLLWFWVVAVFWGIAVLWNAWSVFGKRVSFTRKGEEREIRVRLEEEGRMRGKKKA